MSKKSKKQIDKLKQMAGAYRDACENDYCTDAFPAYAGNRADEIARMIVQEIERLR